MRDESRSDCGESDGRRASERYWLVRPNGFRQLIDPRQFDLERLAEQVQKLGARLVVESQTFVAEPGTEYPTQPETFPDGPPRRFEPPVSALGGLFRSRVEKIYACLSRRGQAVDGQLIP